jgi:large subunit ribosomal protein L16
MLQPKKMKHRKWQKGKSRGRLKETRGTKLSFGKFGIQALTPSWINSNQIEAARKAIAHYCKKGGKIWVRVFPDKPVTQLPPEVTLGGGKGEVSHYVVPVKPGRVLFELDGLPKEEALKALRSAGFKLPVRTRIISR